MTCDELNSPAVENLDFTLTTVCEIWVADDRSLVLRDADDLFYAGSLPRPAVPGAMLSPLLNPDCRKR